MLETRSPQDDLAEDLLAFAPAPCGVIRFQGQTYPVRDYLDLTVQETLGLVRAERQAEATGALDAWAARNLREITLLVPSLPVETRTRLTLRQMAEIASAARRTANAAAGEEQGEEAPVTIGLWVATLCRFYGWTPDTVLRLTMRQFYRFLALAPRIEAREAILGSTVAAFPHLTEEGRSNTSDRWQRIAGLSRGPTMDQTPRVPWDSVRRFIGAKG